MTTPWIYVFVRTDIPVANQMVQAAHVCHIAGRDFKHPDNTHMALLKIKNEKKLLEVAEKLDKHGIKYSLYLEPDYPKGYTALATEPIYGKVRELFEKYKLWDMV